MADPGASVNIAARHHLASQLARQPPVTHTGWGVEEADGNKPTHPTPYQVFDAAASPNNEMLLMHDSGARRISIVVELHEVDFPLLLLCSVWMTLCCLRYNFPFLCLSNVNLNTLMNMFSVLGAGGGLGGRNASNGPFMWHT
uniref:Uncharacterized protein n=1 Tax=Zea mays TaxID=4577 RepID=A0A804QHS0_MAIZE